MHLGETAQACGPFSDAARLAPQDPRPFAALAKAFRQRGQLAEAAEACRQALVLDGRNTEAIQEGFLLLRMQRLPVQAAQLLRLLNPQSQTPSSLAALADTLVETGDYAGAIACIRQRPEWIQASPSLHSNLLRAMLYDPTVTAEDLFNEAGLWGRYHAAPDARAPVAGGSVKLGRPLRVGFLSSRMCVHNTAFYLLNLIRSFSPQKLDVHLFSSTRQEDDITRKLKASAASFTRIEALSDTEACRRIRALQIDVLIDINEHSNEGRLALMAHRPAPFQGHWCGNALTTGLHEVDFRITDALAEPPDEAQRLSHEKLICLDTGYYCYSPPPGAADPRADAPVDQEGTITFGSIANLAKLNKEVLGAWAEILERVPESRLLVARDVLDEPHTRDVLMTRMLHAGIPPHRVRLQGDRGQISSLSIFNSIDIVLDTWPFSGDATTGDALWMGVPVITLKHRLLSGRRAAAHLMRCGFQHLVAETRDEYISLASDLAAQPKRLTQLRQDVQRQFRQSPMCDHARVAKAFEDALFEHLGLSAPPY